MSRNSTKVADLGDDLENWMSKLSSAGRTAPITNISIPGSHDSFTTKMTDDSDISPDAEDIVKALAQLGHLIKHVICNWSKTQSYMAEDQLKRGIRYFDLRISTKDNDDNLWIVHSLYSTTVGPIFTEMNTFLNSHPNEVVILDCQHFFGFNTDIHKKLVSIFKNTFGSKLLPNTNNISQVTLDFMSKNKYQVIIIYRDDATVSGDNSLWPSGTFPNPWPNTTSQSHLIDYLTQGLQSRNASLPFISQCVLTPDADYILEHVTSTLKKKCAEDLEAARLDWITKQKAGQKGLNIIIADFIELSNNQYPKDVVNLNSALFRD